MIASWLNFVHHDICTGLQDEKQDGENRSGAKHVGRFFDASKTLKELASMFAELIHSK